MNIWRYPLVNWENYGYVYFKKIIIWNHSVHEIILHFFCDIFNAILMIINIISLLFFEALIVKCQCYIYKGLLLSWTLMKGFFYLPQ